MEEAHLSCHVAAYPVAQLYMSDVLSQYERCFLPTVCFAGVLPGRLVVELVCFLKSLSLAG